MGIKHAGGQLVQRKAAMLVDNGMPGIAATLKPNDHVGIPGQYICNLTLSSSPQLAPTIAFTIRNPPNLMIAHPPVKRLFAIHSTGQHHAALYSIAEALPKIKSFLRFFYAPPQPHQLLNPCQKMEVT